jgi:hypothetical protein
MVGNNAQATRDTPAYGRRQILKRLSMAAGVAAALGVAGCAQEQASDWKRPDWLRSKQGSNGNGRGRR